MSSRPKIYLAADGFGEDLKNAMKAHVESKGGYEVSDIGVDTYFDAAGRVGKQVGSDPSAKGILVCGTGMGVGIMANKYPGVRAATCENVTAARFARAVNDANVLCLGQLMTTEAQAKEMLDAFLEQQFNVQPKLENGEPAPWWNENVEKFLSTSKEGISRVEQEAIESSIKK
jgi:ribose 5-phosphate isomerase B